MNSRAFLIGESDAMLATGLRLMCLLKHASIYSPFANQLGTHETVVKEILAKRKIDPQDNPSRSSETLRIVCIQLLACEWSSANWEARVTNEVEGKDMQSYRSIQYIQFLRIALKPRQAPVQE